MQPSVVIDTFFQDGKIIRQEKTTRHESFREAANNLIFGKVRQEDFDGGKVVFSRVESIKN